MYMYDCIYVFFAQLVGLSDLCIVWLVNACMYVCGYLSMYAYKLCSQSCSICYHSHECTQLACIFFWHACTQHACIFFWVCEQLYTSIKIDSVLPLARMHTACAWVYLSMHMLDKIFPPFKNIPAIHMRITTQMCSCIYFFLTEHWLWQVWHYFWVRLSEVGHVKKNHEVCWGKS